MRGATATQWLLVPAMVCATGSRPNIVWIMSDDLGWGEVGIYPSTSPHGRIRTPHLDAFGESGMVFSNAYAGYTVCAPSRTTLFTGYLSGHFKAANLNPGGVGPSWNGTLLPQLLHDHGYATAAVGKMAPLTNPTETGFDYFLGQIDQALCHNMYPRCVDSGNSQGNVQLPGNLDIPNSTTKDYQAARTYCMDPANIPSLNYTVDITQEHSLAWIRNEGGTLRDPKKPFFLYQAFTVPHAGGWGWNQSAGGRAMEAGAPVPSDGIYAKESGSWPQTEVDHAAVITYLDKYVGDLLHLLDSQNIANNTVVFFASDNGAHLEGGHDYRFFNSTGGLLGHKRSLYEGGVRSPTMVRWPGVIQAGSKSDFAWAFWDVLPTMADLANASHAVPGGIDGVSILPTLLGRTQPAKEYLAWTWRGTGVSTSAEALGIRLGRKLTLHQDEQGLAFYRDAASGQVVDVDANMGPKQYSGYALRSGDWKVVVPHCGPSEVPAATDLTMVYHLPSDPFETTNLNNTAEGTKQIADLLAIAQKHKITCDCYQC